MQLRIRYILLPIYNILLPIYLVRKKFIIRVRSSPNYY